MTGIAESIGLTNAELTRFFFVVVLLLASSHFFGHLFTRWRLPRVIGEIFGGFLLGSTVLGYFLPTVYGWLFNAFETEGKLLSIIYWFGLILLMFVSGFEIQKTISGEDKKIIFAVILGSTIIPFFVGWLAPSFYNFSPYIGSKNNYLALTIVIAIAAAVTAIPVISKIFIDLDILDTRFAKIVLAAATVHDCILWAGVAVATGLVSTQKVSILRILITVLLTFAFFVIALFVMPKIMRFSNSLKYNFLIKSSPVGYVLFVCFLFSAVASILNVNIVFGAFLAGIVVGLMPHEKFEREKNHIKKMSLAFFVPLYFAIVGLKLDLIHHFDFKFFIFFWLFASTIETLGTLAAMKFIKQDWLSSFNLGVAMNTRGGVGIILATVAFDLGIINETFFVTLVLIAIMTTLMAGCWFSWVISKGWELLKEG